MNNIVRVFGYSALICLSAACWLCGWPTYMSLVFQAFLLIAAGVMEAALWARMVSDWERIQNTKR